MIAETAAAGTGTAKVYVIAFAPPSSLAHRDPDDALFEGLVVSQVASSGYGSVDVELDITSITTAYSYFCWGIAMRNSTNNSFDLYRVNLVALR